MLLSKDADLQDSPYEIELHRMIEDGFDMFLVGNKNDTILSQNIPTKLVIGQSQSIEFITRF